MPPDWCRVPRRARRQAWALACGLLLSFGATSQAEAHAHLKSSEPPSGGIVAGSLASVELTFSEAVNLKFTGVKIVGPSHAGVPTGEAKLLPDGAKTLVVPVTGPLAPGAYTVTWHALATDGHKTDGSYTFTVKP